MFDFIVPLLQIIMIDLVLAGDNAIVIAMATQGLAHENKKKAMFWGISAAVAMRIVFSLAAVWLLQIKGLGFIGGLLLAWVSWKFLKELLHQRDGHDIIDDRDVPEKTLKDAIIAIAVADVSMSLDNVLAVSAASNGHNLLMVIGLLLSVALMAFAANLIARLLEKFKWIAWIGLGIIAYVAGDMLYRGFDEFYAVVFDLINPVIKFIGV